MLIRDGLARCVEPHQRPVLQRMTLYLTRIAAVFLAFLAMAHADQPLRPPQRTVTCSPFETICARSDPDRQVTSVFRRHTGETLWSIAGWHRWLFVSDDGEVMAVGYEGMNLLPVSSDLDLEVLRFYTKGELVRRVVLSELYSDRSELVRTVSHLAWVHVAYVAPSGTLVLELVSGRRVGYYMRTGAPRSLPHRGADAIEGRAP